MLTCEHVDVLHVISLLSFSLIPSPTKLIRFILLYVDLEVVQRRGPQARDHDLLGLEAGRAGLGGDLLLSLLFHYRIIQYDEWSYPYHYYHYCCYYHHYYHCYHHCYNFLNANINCCNPTSERPPASSTKNKQLCL